MRVVLLAYGTRGDVQPYVALGLGLQRAGDSVCLAAPEVFDRFIRSFGLDFYPLPGDPARLIAALVAGGQSPVRAASAMLRFLRPLAAPLAAAVEAACAGADLIVHSFVLTALGHAAARRIGVPDVSALIFPVFTPTAAFPNPLFPAWPLGAAYNRQTHLQFDSVFQMGNRLLSARAGRAFAWPFAPRNPAPRPILYGISPSALPRPDDWGSQAELTGYWALPDETGWQPPAGLLRFLERGAPPVLVGFGSLVNLDPARQTRLVLEALQRSGRRGLLLTGWGGLEPPEISERVYTLKQAPLTWLLPRVAAAVHHGGVGTTATVLTAGLPAVIVPHMGDQYFWGRRVWQLGVGPRPLPRSRLTSDDLARAIRAAVEDDALRQRAAELGAKIRAEDGVAAAVARIHQIVGMEG